MPTIGFHASHEQLPPSELLAAAKAAEAAGFESLMCSDHLAPWSRQQGHSGFAWSWLAAALEATSLPCGVVTAPGQRYHPAITAQAIATLGEMYPGRFWAALGSGEALNEHVTGDPWPDKEVRDARLLECVAVIRSLLDGEEVTVDGLVRVHRARVWSLPGRPPPLIGAAVSTETAAEVGGWADGLITINQPVPELRAVVDAFRQGGGDGRPVHVQVHLSWADSEDQALAVAYEQWRTNIHGSSLGWELEQPEQFEEAARFVRPDDVRVSVMVSADLSQHAAWLAAIAEAGVDAIHLHHVGNRLADQCRFVDAFGGAVLPELRGA